jgi:hypothetical protein
MYSSTILNLTLDGGQWSASQTCSFAPWEQIPSIYCIGGWVDLRASLDVMEKKKISCPRQKLNPQSLVAQPVA